VDNVTGTAGNDTVKATAADFQALDVVAAGEGTDTLAIVDTAAFTGFGSASLTGFEALSISTTGAIGALYSAGSSAGSNTSPVGAVQTLTVSASATYAATNQINLRIGDAFYTLNPSSTTAASVATAISDALKARLGGDGANANATNDLVTVGISGTDSNIITITSQKPGTALPTITASVQTSSSVTTAVGSVTSAFSTDNKTGTGPGAIKEVVQIALTNTNGTTAGANDYLDAGDAVKVSINGVDYATAASGTTAADVAKDVAAVINSALGAGSATAAGSVVTVTALTAGTPLPYVNVTSAAATGLADAMSVVVANQAANAAAGTAASASAIAAPTGVTSYTASSSGVANVSAAATSTIKVSGTSVQTSGGSDVTVTASGSVGVIGAKGAVVVGTSNPSATSGNVSSNAGTGQTTTYGTGVYVTGGTTVSITQGGATIDTGVAGSARTNTIQVGVDPTGVLNDGTGVFDGAVKSPSSNTFFNAVGGLASDPTGNVTVTAQTAYTTAAGRSAVAYAGAAQKIFVNGADTVSLTGVGSSSSITDVNTQLVQTSATDVTGVAAGASKLTTVNLTGLSASLTVKSDVLSTLSIVNGTSGTVTISNSGTEGANSGALKLTVGNSTASVTSATHTSVNVGTTTTSFQTIDGTAPVLNSNALTLNAAKATSLTFSNASSVTLTNGGLAKVATVTATGSGTLNLGDLSTGWTKLASVDASAATGSVTATLGATPADAGLSVITGSGNDTITLIGNIAATSGTNGGLVSTNISLGGGNDSLLIGTNGVVGAATAAIDAGAGTDTVSAALVNAGNAALFKNFERVAVKGAADSATLDASLLTNSTISGVALNGDLAAGANNIYTVSNIAGTDVNFEVTASTADKVRGTLASATGTADTATVNFASFNAVANANATVTAAGVVTTGLETLNINSGGTIVNTSTFDAVALDNVLTSFEDTGNSIAKVVITGDKQLTLGAVSVSVNGTSKAITAATFTTDFITQKATNAVAITNGTEVQSALTLIDGSAATGSLYVYGGVSNAINDGTDSSQSLVFDGLAIKGGSAADAIRNDAYLGSIDGGAGDDWLVVGGFAGSATGGAGKDTLAAAAQKVTLTGGAGVDTFVVGAGAVFTATATSAVDAPTAATASVTDFTPTSAMTTVTDAVTGDKLDVSAVASLSALAVFSVTSYTTLDDAIDGAIVDADAGNWFVWGGNTYIVVDGTAVAGGGVGAYTDNENNAVIKLNGIFDLTTATVSSGIITFG